MVSANSAGSELARSVGGVVVAFEADEVDAVVHAGWSVVVTGRATVVTDPAEHERLTRTGYLIGGLLKPDLPLAAPHSPVWNALDSEDFALAPLPNHPFPRDNSCWI